tara:strand:- start:331 stop:765 length:435 start_codon:yes stop_codon:yes gene_type:complete
MKPYQMPSGISQMMPNNSPLAGLHQQAQAVGGKSFPLAVPGQPQQQQLPNQDYINSLMDKGGDDAMEEIEFWVEQSGGKLKSPWDRDMQPPTGYSPSYQFPKPDANGNTTFNADNPDDAMALREFLKTLPSNPSPLLGLQPPRR